jgi:hypothetical protein
LALIVFSTYSAPVTTSASTQAYTISGMVSAEKCPINPAMGMPCTLSPMPGCTVSISPVYAIAGPGIYNLPNIWIRSAITDANGIYSIIFDAQPNLIVDVAAAKAGVGAATPVEVSLVKQSITVNLVLQDVVITPPPTQGTATLQGTVYVTSCPPATTPPMGMPCSRNSVPQCTVVVVPTAVPMIYPVPPQYLPHTTVTDANGRYSLDLPIGDYIVKAQKTGLGFAQAAATITANQTSTLDLTLFAKDTLPVSSTGTASVQGTVKEVINPPNPAMSMASVVQPVAGCTVLVCAAVMPIMYAESAGGSGSGSVNSGGSAAIADATSAPAVLVARQYITITDSNGHYSFKDLPVYGTTYSAVLMAKKERKFGHVQADLVNGQTKTVDIIISEAAVVLTDASAVPPDMYQNYYAATVKALSIATIKDTVTVTPPSPTIKDSLDFSLFAANLSCGGIVHGDTVIVADTNIYLSFSYQVCPACDCISLGQWIPFHSKPLKAGTYGIYKEQSIYCEPGTPCPMIAIIPEHVGQVTVRPTTAVLAGTAAVAHRATVSFERSSKLLLLSLPAEQIVTLELFGLNGKKISTVLDNTKFSAGIHALSMNTFANARGCFIARIKSDAGESTELLAITK